jgi:hypothetical protein
MRFAEFVIPLLLRFADYTTSLRSINFNMIERLPAIMTICLPWPLQPVNMGLVHQRTRADRHGRSRREHVFTVRHVASDPWFRNPSAMAATLLPIQNDRVRYEPQ